MKINVKINLIVFLNLTMIYLLFNSAAIAGISSRSTLIPIEVNHKVGYMNKYGEMIIPPHFDNGKYFNDSGLAVVRIGEKWGYIDKRGKTIIPFKYDSAEYFRYDGGLTPVRINQKWGYIDSSDRMIIKPIFDYATHFYFGIAEVRLNDKWGYINQSGKFVIVPKYSRTSTPERNGLLHVSKDGKHGYLSKDGKVIIPMIYEYISSFSEGLSQIVLNGKYGYINKRNKRVIDPKFEDAGYFKEGLASIKLNGKYGYINNRGIIIISAIYDSAGSFRKNGIARVKLNERYMLIDKKGNVVKKFDSGMGRFGGLYQGLESFDINGGKDGYINENGDIVIPPRFDTAYVFQKGGHASIGINGKSGVIDRTGRIIAIQANRCGREVLINEEGNILWPRNFNSNCYTSTGSNASSNCSGKLNVKIEQYSPLGDFTAESFSVKIRSVSGTYYERQKDGGSAFTKDSSAQFWGMCSGDYEINVTGCDVKGKCNSGRISYKFPGGSKSLIYNISNGTVFERNW